MSFISSWFLLFFVVVFFIYWFIKKADLKYQNTFLLLASYFFYAFWSWKFLILLFSISLANYLIGIETGRDEQKIKRKTWLIAGLIINIGNLVIFKYFSFFIEEFISLVSVFGISLHKTTLTLIIPLGISFYTFLSISYLVDIYRRTIEPEKNPLHVLLSLSFFPIIFSGPIQRPSSLLPQIKTARVFNYPDMVSGLRQILWGLFTKLVIADNLAPIVNEIFLHPEKQDGAAWLLGMLFFAVQIYADFSAYSDIAIGLARLLGFNLMRNFAFPYFALNIAEFWKRWHISLTSWFRDYLFLPVAYTVSKKIKGDLVLFIKTDYIIYAVGIAVTWLITGLWHGANVTFLIWGLLHGSFLIIYQLQKKSRKQLFKSLKIRQDNRVVVGAEAVITISYVVFAWIFFRADNIDQAFSIVHKLFSSSVFRLPELLMKEFINVSLIIVFFLFEWDGRTNGFAIEKTAASWPWMLRWAFYSVMVCAIFLFSQSKSSEFLYFKF
jgi:D-alanyl-lipoteichoic acid acyltransferase DltB (MBOAT superfamily)